MRWLYYGSGGGDRSVLLGTYEPGVQQAMTDVLKKGHVFYDVGANEGYFSLLAVPRSLDLEGTCTPLSPFLRTVNV